MTKMRKILLSIAAIGTTASIAGLGTFASFTGTASDNQAISTGTLSVAIGANGGSSGDANNRLTVGASNIVPGDSMQRRFLLRNTGNVNLASVTLGTTASPSNVLTTDGTNGLQMKLEKCSGTWTESVAAPYTYTCDLIPGTGLNNGTRTTVLAQGPIIQSSATLNNLSSLTAGSQDDVVLTESLPSAAGNTFQTQSATVTFTFTGTQRGSTNQ